MLYCKCCPLEDVFVGFKKKKNVLKLFLEKNVLLYDQGSHARCFFLSGALSRVTYTSCRPPIGTGGPEVQMLCA